MKVSFPRKRESIVSVNTGFPITTIGNDKQVKNGVFQHSKYVKIFKMIKTILKTAAISLIFFLIYSGIPVNAQPIDVFALCREYKPFSIDISSLFDFYQALSVDEKEEQLKDWAFYGLLSSLGVKEEEMPSLFDEWVPMRYPSLEYKQKYTVLPGRIIALDEKTCIMLAPQNQIDDNLTLGFIFDQGTFSLDSAPENVYLFSYQEDLPNKKVTTSFIRTVPGEKFLSQDYGYLKKNISDSASLTQFLEEINSINSIQFKDNSVILGGRRNKSGKSASLSLEDVATLHQAYIKVVPPEVEKERRKSYDVFISQKYDKMLKTDKQLRKAIKSGNVKYNHIITEIKKRYPYKALEDEDVNAGFSLDPLLDYNGLSMDLKNLALKTGRFSDIAKDPGLLSYVDSHAAALSKAADKIATRHDLTPLLKFKRTLPARKNNNEQHFDAILQDIELTNTYQTARYDGKMKGTGSAMILFYTDLTAKLWALDFNNLSPKNHIPGFRNLAEIKVPKLYWDDFVKLSKTRLWFGLRQESFDINGGSISFEPVATRVYAASSDPLYPGKETKPNFQSGRFLGWWDNHYSSVADYEPYYYKLNEVLKWSCIFMVAKQKHFRSLDFLSGIPVNRGLDFESWYKGQNELKNKTALPFIDGIKYGKTTECFKLLHSNYYPLMGRQYFISGGVSLASKKDILKKLSMTPTAQKSGKYRPAGELTSPGKEKRSAKINKTLKKVKPSKITEAGKETSLKKPDEAADNFGHFSAKTEKQTVILEWNRKEGAVLDECVNSLVNFQETDKKSRKNETIFKGLKDAEKLVRLEPGKAYLIRIKTLKDKWIYLAINPQKKLHEFTAKAAGTEPDSDIFYAKTITASLAEKLSAGKEAFNLGVNEKPIAP